MIKKAVILHGTLGSPEGNWFEWLEHELSERNIHVWVPALPHADEPSMSWWSRYVHENRAFELDSETILIGHSSGAALALIVAQQNRQTLGGVVAVSAFHNNSLQWAPNNKLFDVDFDWQSIQSKAGTLLFVHSDNDPYVPLDQAQFMSSQTGGELVVLPGQGHFNLEQGDQYREFPALLELMTQRYQL